VRLKCLVALDIPKLARLGVSFCLLGLRKNKNLPLVTPFK